MEKLEKLLSKYSWLLVIALSLPAVASLFVPGFFGASDDLHIGWLYEMDRAIKMGQFPPRYVPDLSYGFGYPLFNFVFPLPFYLAEVFHLLGLSLVGSIKAVFLLSVPLSFYFMYRFLKEYASPLSALFGATMYVYVPYRAADIFVRGAVGEILAFVFLPLILLSLTKIEENKKWLGITALSMAALITSHNIIAYMFIPAVILYLVGVVILKKKDYSPTLKRISAALVLGLSSSVYFWGPAIWESSLMQYSTVFNFADHFPTIKQLVTPYFGYGASVPGPGDGMSFFLGTMSLLIVAIGVVTAFFLRKKYSKKELWLLTWAGVVFFASVFMMNHRSSFLWENVPYLPYFQFPWRLLTLTTFTAPIFVIALSKLEVKRWAWAVLIVLTVILNFNYFKPQDFLGRDDDYYLNRYIPVPYASEEYATTAEEYLRLPKGTRVRPERVYPRAYADVRANIRVQEVNALDAKITTDYPVSFTLNYNKYYFPGFVAKIDEEPVDIIVGEPYGQISVMVPGGVHSVEIMYKETPFRKVLNIISLGAILASFYLIFKGKNGK